MHHEQPIAVDVACSASHFRWASSVVHRFATTVSSAPDAISTPLWWADACTGSTTLPNILREECQAYRRSNPFGCGTSVTCAITCLLSLPFTKTDEAASAPVTTGSLPQR